MLLDCNAEEMNSFYNGLVFSKCPPPLMDYIDSTAP